MLELLLRIHMNLPEATRTLLNALLQYLRDLWPCLHNRCDVPGSPLSYVMALQSVHATVK
jgi:hypothetical protein